MRTNVPNVRANEECSCLRPRDHCNRSKCPVTTVTFRLFHEAVSTSEVNIASDGIGTIMTGYRDGRPGFSSIQGKRFLSISQRPDRYLGVFAGGKAAVS